MVTVTQIYFDDRDATWKSFVEKAIAYDSMNNVIKELDAMGYIAGTGDTIAERIATGYGMTYTYNLAGMRVTELDPESAALGLSWSMRYTYDALGRLTFTENIEGTIARTEYDLAGNVVRQTVRENASAPEQTILTATYDFAGNVLTQTDANGYTVTNTYNALNKLRSTTMPGDASMPSVTAYNQYNRYALVSSSWSTAGVLQTYTYDNLGHLLSLSKSEVDGDRAITKYFRYDHNGNLVYGTDGNGNVTEYTYDAMNRVILTTQGGKTTGTTYDANGNQLTATDWLGNTVTNVYDALNRLVEKRDAFDLPQETYFYDESSRQIAAEDVMGRRTTYEYDRNNRLVLTTAPDGYTVAQTYDRRGNVVTQTDVLGNTTYYAYDFLGRLVSVTDELSQSTTFTYDLKGNLLSQTDSAGNTTYLEYNSRDRVIRKVSPGGRTGEPGAYIYDPTAVISYTYDALGNTATRTDRNGNTTVFEWDVHGNLVRQAIGTNEISYTYDNNGNVLTTTDSLGTTTRVYDAFNRCVEKTVPIIGTSTYAYDITSGLPAGHVAETTTDPYGNQTLREYDRTGRLARVTDTAADLTTHTVIYTYNDNGSVTSVLYPDGAREDYTYTDGNLLSTLINTLSDGTVLETYVYTYDISRNLLTKQDAKGTTAYTYDPLGRVLTVTEPSGKLTEYAFDAAGNRSTQTVTETGEDESVTVIRTTYTYDVRNRLIQLQKHDISDPLVDPILLDVTDYMYDHSGNQLTTTRTTYTDGVAGTPVMVQSNTYDVWNQLIRTETENGTVVENAYNGDGRRVIKTVNGSSTYYLYEYDKVILETNVYGDFTGRNIYGLNLLIRTVGVDTFYYMYNGHADVTVLLTPSGTVAASYYYDAFGNILEQTGDVNNSVLFAGYQYDKETGLYYLNARMYDPVTARFMQEDTYAGQQSDPLSLNLYTYCHNSPLMYWDPTGHWSLPSWDDITDAVSDAWDATTEFVNGVADTVSDAWDKTKEVASNVANKAADLWTATTNTVSQYIDKAKEAAKTFVDTTGKVVESAIDTVKDTANKINDKVVQPIKNTVAKAVKDVKEKATEIVESGKQLVADAFKSANETAVGKFLYNLGESTVNLFQDAYTYVKETPVDQMMYELGESTVNLLKDFGEGIYEVGTGLGEDLYNYDRNNQDSTKVQNSNFFSYYKGKFVFFYPGEILGYDTGGGFSLGIIGISEDVKNDYSKNFIPGKSYFQAVLEHEWGHTQQLAEMGLKEYVRDIAIPSFTYAALDSSRPYGTYHGSPFEYGADEYAGNVWPNPIWPGTDPLAGQWYDTYMRADAEQRKYYRDNPEQLKQDSAAFNTRSSYSLDEYEYQKRQSGA